MWKGDGRAFSLPRVGSPGGDSGLERISEIAWFQKSFSILRIFTGFRIPQLPNIKTRCGPEGTEPLPTERKRSCVPTQVFASWRASHWGQSEGLSTRGKQVHTYFGRMTQSDEVIVHI